MALQVLNYTKLPMMKISRALVQWKNFLATKKKQITYTLGQQKSSYVTRISSEKFKLSEYKYGVLIEIDGVPASVWLTSWPLAQRLEGYLSGTDLEKLPVDLRAELLEAAYKPLLSALIFQTNTPIRIINFLNLKPSDVNEYSLGVTFYDNDTSQESKIIILMHDKLVPVVKKLLAYWPNKENNYWNHKDTEMWMQMGSLEISMKELNQLEPSDILMMETDGHDGWVLLRLGSGDYFQAVIQANKLILKSGVQKMSEQNNDENIASIDEVPVRLTFDLGDLTIPFNEVKSLTLGSIVDLNTPITQAVRIRSLNRIVGTGELVNIDGHMGVRIVKLFAKIQAESVDG